MVSGAMIRACQFSGVDVQVKSSVSLNARELIVLTMDAIIALRSKQSVNRNDHDSDDAWCWTYRQPKHNKKPSPTLTLSAKLVCWMTMAGKTVKKRSVRVLRASEQSVTAPLAHPDRIYGQTCYSHPET